MTTLDTAATTQTLAQRLAQGRIPVPEALRYSMILAESLRKLHDSGQVHGAVSPASIAVTRNGLELLTVLGNLGTVSPYTAPEVLRGQRADSRSDIFSFGAILYEMLTGRAAFEGEGEDLRSAIFNSVPAPSGSPAVDRLVSNCLAKDPDARWQRMQKMLLELKLLAVAVQRAESPAPRRAITESAAAMRAEVQQVEARVNERLARHEATLAAAHERMAQAERTALELESRLAERLGHHENGIGAVNERISHAENSLRETGAGLTAFQNLITERLAQIERSASEALGLMEREYHERLERLEQAIGSTGSRVEGVDQKLESLRSEAASLRETVSDDLANLDRSIKSQSAAIDSARTAMAQTDDLVERVVEALESLQSVVLEHSGERGGAV
jgi:hypothetical protein